MAMLSLPLLVVLTVCYFAFVSVANASVVEAALHWNPELDSNRFHTWPLGRETDEEDGEQNEADEDDDDEDDEDDEYDRYYKYIIGQLANKTYSDRWELDAGANTFEGNLHDFYRALNCSDVFSSTVRPIHNESMWMLLRGAYVGTVGPLLSSIPMQDMYGDGFEVKYYVDYVPGKGRGVFAGEDIPKGTEVWTDSRTAIFVWGAYYRRFLASIPNDLACDVLVWAYVEREVVDGEESSIIGVDLDPCSLMNTVSTPDELNVGQDYVATRDITAGEELLVDYGSFHVHDGWDEFGL